MGWLKVYLKKLEVQGFKSFADKVCLEFDSGITSVVGPNGSGKSNISDSIRWVLGEQSAKTLRGGKMEDVIFAGTEHRKPLGFCEVSLTIDNKNNILPIGYSEVTVTRRVYRSGESEFMINKTQCRLKDIHQLFMDTGLGKDGYSIIGQGRVDEILSSKSEDRRLIFEEASGIMKYKVRKLESERKLEATRQNLLRIEDIINELETQLEPLAMQSEKARKYLSLRESLKELEVSIFVENISKMKEKLKEYENSYQILEASIEKENFELENINLKNQEKIAALKELEETLEKAKNEYYEFESEIERTNSDIKLAIEKINSNGNSIQRIDNEILEAQKRINEFSNEEKIRLKKIDELEKKLEGYSQKLNEDEQKLKKLFSVLTENEKYIDTLNNNIIDKISCRSDKTIEINNVTGLIENIAKRMADIDVEIKQLGEEEKDIYKIQEDVLSNIEKLKNTIQSTNNSLKDLNKQKTDMTKELEFKNKEYNEIYSKIQIKSSRQNMLIEMEKNLEGYGRSVKLLLKACMESSDLGMGVHGALAQLIKVDKKYETAIEMTLGAALQNVVTSDEGAAKKAIQYLKDKNLGRATFLPITAMKGRVLEESTRREVYKMKGFLGIASDLIKTDDKYKDIIFNFLGKVVVIDNLDNAIKIARNFEYGFRIVTLEGEILSTSGSMSGGSNNNRETGIISRNREIEELQQIIEKLKVDVVNLENNLFETNKKIEKVVVDLQTEEALIKDCELTLVREESYLYKLSEDIKRIVSKSAMLKDEVDENMKKEAENIKLQKKLQLEFNEIENQIKEIKDIIQNYQEKNKEEQVSKEVLNKDVTNYKIIINTSKEIVKTANEDIKRIKAEKEMLIESVCKKEKEKRDTENEIINLQKSIDALKEKNDNYAMVKAKKTKEVNELTNDKKEFEEKTAQFIVLIKEVNKNIFCLKEDYNRIEVKKAKIETEMESVQNKMWEEYELTYSNAVLLKKDIENLAQAQRTINEYKSKIRELGPVNVVAIEEYAKTKERYEFMSNQKGDMENASEKLQKVIYEMTLIMKRQFLEQFKLINDNFNIVFRELFEGGRAELRLIDKDNVLESGIEIEVQPPGKKLQNMMLLSGGERAFTAIALLFSILKLRPAPFCVLDEIEAALDDANVYRFAQYIKRHTNLTQFIMITHKKGTMEVSDTLYGVTMQERGISKVVSMKLGDKVG